MTNHAETSPHAEDPRLRTRWYATDVDGVARAIEAIVPRLRTYLRRWRLVRRDAPGAAGSDRERTFHVEVPVVVFTDDLVLRVSADATGFSRVDVTSRARVGKGDFGENRRHVAQVLRALDGLLAAAHDTPALDVEERLSVLG